MTIQKQKHLRKQVAPYEKSDTWHSVRQLVNTLVPFLYYGSWLIKAYRFHIYLR